MPRLMQTSTTRWLSGCVSSFNNRHLWLWPDVTSQFTQPTHTDSHKYRRSSVGGKEIKAYFYSTGKSIVGPRLPLHKVDCFQQHCLFISVEHPHLSPFVKPRNILNLAIQNIFFCTVIRGICFYTQSGVSQKISYGPSQTVSIAFSFHKYNSSPLGLLL